METVNVVDSVQEKPTKREIINAQNMKIIQLEKDLKQQTEYKEMYQKREQEAAREISDLHDFLDGLPNVLPKKKTDYGEHKATTRLLSWVASKANL